MKTLLPVARSRQLCIHGWVVTIWTLLLLWTCSSPAQSISGTNQPGTWKDVPLSIDSGTTNVGNPLMALVPGSVLPRSEGIYGSLFDSYGAEGGRLDTRQEGVDRITRANPSGAYTLLVKANTDSGQIPDASYTIRIQTVETSSLAFDLGTATVTDQEPGSWRYFQVGVPPGAAGWDLRVADVTNCLPQIVVRRGQLPDQLYTSTGPEGPAWYYGPQYGTNWPEGYQVAAYHDYTGRIYPVEGYFAEVGRILTLSMGNPLEPGTYFVGVLNTGPASGPATYTLVSRGIGVGLALPVIPLPYQGGSVTVASLAAREAAFYRVTIPDGAPGWQLKLSLLAGEALLAVQKNALPHTEASPVGPVDFPPAEGGKRMQKIGNEHFLLLPDEGQASLSPGDYFIAVVSEGLATEDNRIGPGSSDIELTSFGPLVAGDLGTIGPTEVVQPASLEGGAVRAYQFSVAPGVSSLEIQLLDRVGNPYLVVAPGADWPYRGLWDPASGLDLYGVIGGQTTGRLEDPELITLANPAPGLYSLLVKGRALDVMERQFVGSTFTLSVRAASTSELPFDGGTATVTNQSPGAWTFYRVQVPAEAAGWDLRLTEVAAGQPRLVVRRDLLPETLLLEDWGYQTPFSFTNWPSGKHLANEQDWTSRPWTVDGAVQERWRILAMGMGNPLEPGVYYVGVYNEDPWTAANYRLLSRGIGDGLSLPVVDLAFDGGQASHPGLLAREAAYYRVTIPEGASSWKVKLSLLAGEALLAVQQHTPPSSAVSRFVTDNALYPPPQGWVPGGRNLQKAGAEQFVLLPREGSEGIPAGAYYLAVVSEGVNPADDWHIGEGTCSYTLASLGELETIDLGDTSSGLLQHQQALEGGELAIYGFTVPPGTPALEARLADRQGNPVLGLRPGDQPGYAHNPSFPLLGYYGVDGGHATGLLGDPAIITVPNPEPGSYRLVVKARSSDDERTFPQASYHLQVRGLSVPALNFSRELNSFGGTNAASALLADNQRALYRVTVPATLDGLPVLGWTLDLSTALGCAWVRVSKDLLPTDDAPGTTQFAQSAAVVVPPYLEPGTWYVEIKAEGSTEFTLVSGLLALERPAWTMPEPGQPSITPGLSAPEFADSGLDSFGQVLPGDQGVYLDDGKYHFYAFTVPTNNLGLVRVTLETINGDPNLYARIGLPPTLTHDQHGSLYQYLVDRAMTGIGTEYGSWVPGNGTVQQQLVPGTWYVAVRAEGGFNARYRLRLSSGNIQDLALDGGSLSGQLLSAGDWRYYRVRLPVIPPAQWQVTLSHQAGEVEMFVRDTMPPGDRAYRDYWVPVRDWAFDNKNHGPYPQGLTEGTHTLTVPPLRPGHVYYLGLRARSDAAFTVRSAVGGVLPSIQALAFAGGSVSGTLGPGEARLFSVQVPPEAARWRHTAVHSGEVMVCLEQGTLPLPWQSHWQSYYADSSHNVYLRPPQTWPWVPGQTYFLLVTNQSGSPQAFGLTLDGRDLATDDEDQDGLPDAWEMQHFQGTWFQDANTDSDGDGLSNGREFELGTNPTDPRTRGMFSTVEVLSGGRVRLQFQSEAGQDYQVEGSIDLTHWFPVRSITDSPGTVWIEETMPSSRLQFYRSVLVPR